MLGWLKKSLVTVLTPEPWLARCRRLRLQDRILSLMYHEVLPDAAPVEAWTVVRESDFRRQMRYVRDHFEILTMDQAIAAIASGSERRAPAAVITFDDGYWGNRHVAWAVVEELNIPITIFVATAAVQDQVPYWYDRVIAAFPADRSALLDLRDQGLGCYRVDRLQTGERRWTQIQRLLADCKQLAPERRALVVEQLVQRVAAQAPGSVPLRSMSMDDIRTMAKSDRICFGAHSHCHSILTQFGRDDIRETVLRSKTLLESWTGKPVRHFAYPNGDFNETVADVIRECGFVSSQTTVSGYWGSEDSAYAIPRIGVGRFDRLGWFQARVSGLCS